MKRVVWMTIGFILLFVGAFYGAQKIQQCPFSTSAKSGYCCAQAGFHQKFATTAEQQKSLLALDQEFLKEKNRLCMELCQSRYRLGFLLRESTVSQEQLDEKTAEVASIQLAMERSATAHILKVKEVLTPEQAKKYMESLYQDVCRGINSASCGFAVPEEKG